MGTKQIRTERWHFEDGFYADVLFRETEEGSDEFERLGERDYEADHGERIDPPVEETLEERTAKIRAQGELFLEQLQAGGDA